MPAFDASSMIHVWDNYPEPQFPPFWEWIKKQIEARALIMSAVAFDEVIHKAPDCAAWLMRAGLEKVDVTNAILQNAMRIKALLGVVNDRYHPNGVDENDLIIIASALAVGIDLVSEENQPNPPKDPVKRKIPTVCKMQQVSQPCIKFLDYLKASGAVFG
jgi:hypothetical protein